jgi:acyl transferase domain-containing protein/acyl carrier protein
MNRCFNILNGLLDYDIKEVLYPHSDCRGGSPCPPKDCIGPSGQGDHRESPLQPDRIDQTEIAQPLIFIIEYALAKLLINWGIKPYAMIGHSIGEYTAACLSGVFSLEDALQIVAIRGQLMQRLPEGSMLSVPLAEKELIPLLNSQDELSLAAVNSKSHCVVSGPHEAIDTFARQLKEKGHETRPLHTSHAFHSKMMEPMLKEFEQKVSEPALEEKADIPYISNITGTWASIKEAASPRYWVNHIRNTVRFGDGVTELLKNGRAIFVEVGPGRSLSTFVRQHENKKPGQKVIDLIRHPQEEVSDTYYLLNKVGLLWIYGKAVDWVGFYGSKKQRRISLPTYPFKGQRYNFPGPLLKIDKNQLTARQRQTLPTTQIPKPGKKANMAQWFYVPSWKPSPPVIQLEHQEQDEKYLVLANEEKLVSRLLKRLKQSIPGVTVVKTGAGFTRLVDSEYTVNPQQEDDYHTLFKELKSTNKIPHKIVHCWNVTGNENKSGAGVGDFTKLDRTRDLGFYSLLYLARAIGRQGIGSDKQTDVKVGIIVLTNGMQAVTGKDEPEPQKALIRGAVQVIPVEYQNLSCRSIDIDYPPTAPVSQSDQQDQPALPERLLKIIETEIRNSTPAPNLYLYTAYRNNQRWVQTYEPMPLEMSDPVPLILKEKGVYLVTGGLGGIGLVLAEYLAKNFKARLVLTGRSPFPHRDQWEEWQRTHDTTDETAVKIRKIREWEASGAEVLILCADVADMQQMQTAAAQAEERFGKINGIIHSAGLPDGGLIPNRTREMSEIVLSPKVKGTLVLDSLFNSSTGHQLDFLVLCSSIGSVLSPIGQVAYCAANAFLDAFALYNTARSNTYTVSINWDSWQEVGMAVKALNRLFSSYTAPPAHQQKIDHPLFDTYSSDNPDQAIFISRFRTDRHWVLEEHRMLEKAVLPGTAFLEMARAALENHEKNSAPAGTLQLENVFFLTPLIVNDEEEKDIRTILEKENNGYTFSITSRAKPGEDQWIEHAKGEARVIPKEEPVKYQIPGIAARLQGDEVIYHPEDWTGILNKEMDRGRRLMVFGPRWNSLRRVKAGENQALSYLELPETFTPELEFFKLHPALLDMATLSSRLSQEYDRMYLPYSYKKIRIKNTLTGNVFCHARSNKNNSSQQELINYDFTLMDEQGMELVEIEGYALRRLNLEDREFPLPSPRENTLKDALLPAEGVEVFKRVLAAQMWPQVVVSTTDLWERIRESRDSSIVSLADQSPGEMPSIPRQPRPELSTQYVPPDSEIQHRLSQIWQQFLGIEKVGIHDDFFELGGDSLKLMTISAKIHKELDIEIPLTEFFNRPTILKLDQYINATGKDSKGTYSIIEPVEDKEYYPLSPAQKRLYMLQQMDMESVAYHLPFAFILQGQVNRDKLEQVFSRLIRRQESFRTSFILVDGEGMQKIQDEVEFEIEYDDLTGTREPAPGSSRAAASTIKNFIRPFNLARAPLMRVGLIKTAPEEYILLLDMHHIISDGTSMGVFVREFTALYQEKELPRLPIRYKDYSQWQDQQYNSENGSHKRQEDYWLKEFAGEIPTRDLPTDFPRPDIQDFAGGSFPFTLSSKDTTGLKKIASAEEASLFTVLLSLLNILFSKITGQDDILMGTQVAGRRHSDLENIIGVFINTLVLRNYPQKEKTFKEFLKETRERTLNAFENQEYPFENLVKKRLGKRKPNRNPFFDVMFVWQNWTAGEIRIPGLTLKPCEKELKQDALLDLSFYGQDDGEHLSFTLEYSTTLFKKETIERFIEYFREIISMVTADKEVHLKDIKISHDLSKAKSGVFQDEDQEFGF